MTKFADLKYHYGIVLRIYPNYHQMKIIKLNDAAGRFFYNKQIEIDNRNRRWRHDMHEHYGTAVYTDPIISDWFEHFGQSRTYERKVTEMRKQKYPWLKNSLLDSLNFATQLQNHRRAWQNYHNQLQNRPTYHAKRNHPYEWRYQTACQYTKTSQSVEIIYNKYIKLPKIKQVRVAYVQPVIRNKKDYRIGTVTIKKDNLDHFYVSLQLGSDTPFVKSKPKTNCKVGIDLNIENFLTDSYGHVIDNPKFYQTQQNKLKVLQRSLSRKQRHNKKLHRDLKACQNYQSNRKQVAKLQQQIRQRRQNFLNVVSMALIDNQDLVVAENLKSKNMLKNYRLSQKISDVGWRIFLTMLDRKAAMYDKQFIMINPAYTTQTCYHCKYVMGSDDRSYKLKLSDRSWDCPNCHIHHIRDINAARNILNKGLLKLIES